MPENKRNPSGRENKPAAVQSIYRAAGVLSCIGNQVNSMTEIAQDCNLSNSTVHRLLQALEESKMVIQDPVSRKYYFGDMITRLVSNIQVPYEYFITVAREFLKELAESTSETISLAVLVGQQYNVLLEIPSKHKLRVVETGVNSIEPLQPAGAAGQVLLSQLEEKELEIRVRNIQLTSQIEDVDRFISEIRRIKRQKFAVSHNEVVPGAMCISAAVTHYISPAAISIYGPTERIKPQADSYTAQLLESAQAISKRLSATARAK